MSMKGMAAVAFAGLDGAFTDRQKEEDDAVFNGQASECPALRKEAMVFHEAGHVTAAAA